MALLEDLGSAPHAHIFRSESGYAALGTEDALAAAERFVSAQCGAVVQILGTGRRAFMAAVAARTEVPVVFASAAALPECPAACAQALIQRRRRACAVRLHEPRRVITGEVTAHTPGRLTLRTADMESSFEIGANMQAELVREGVRVGDVVRILPELGLATRLGLAEANADPADLTEFARPVPIPEGECCREQMMDSATTLDELDTLNAAHAEGLPVADVHRDAVDRRVQEWVAADKAELRIGALVVEDAEYLPSGAVSALLQARWPKAAVFLLCSDADGALAATVPLALRLSAVPATAYRAVLDARVAAHGAELPATVLQRICDVTAAGSIDRAVQLTDAAVGTACSSVQELDKLVSLFESPE